MRKLFILISILAIGPTLAADITNPQTDASQLTTGVLPSARLGGMANISATLGAPVALNNIANFFDGPSIAQGSVGTWYISATATVDDVVGSADIGCKLWDGTTVIDSGGSSTAAAGKVASVDLSGVITSPAGNIKISCRDFTSVNGQILNNFTGAGKDTSITAFRIN